MIWSQARQKLCKSQGFYQIGNFNDRVTSLRKLNIGSNTRSHFERLITLETKKFEIFDEIRAFYSNDSNDESEKPH